jgi:serine/threonine protein phosphatase PrpC
MNCPACGTDNREGARFCRGCGAALGELPGAGVEPDAAAEQQEPAVEAPEPEAGASKDVVVDHQPLDEEPELDAETPEPEPELDAEVPEAEPEPVDWDVPPSTVVGTETGIQDEPVVEGDVEDPAADDLDALDEGLVQAPDWAEEELDAEPLEIDDDLLAFWREEIEPLKPGLLGEIIADRYVVIEVLDAQDNEILYLAHDVSRCWQCGFEDNAPGDGFCAQCGASMDRLEEVRLLEVQSALAEPSSGEPVVARLSQEGRTFLLLEHLESGTESAPEALPVAPSARLLVGQLSDAGQVRELDEDSLLAFTLAPTYESRTGPVLGLFVVADGMGGYEGGEVASKLALQTLADQVLRTIVLPELAGAMMLEEDILVRLRQSTIAANDDVYLTRQKSGTEMGTTLTAVFVRDNRLFLAHIGDCRVYRWNGDGLQQLTTDHSVVANLIAEGQVGPEEIYTHPHRSVIYRCIGDKPLVEVDTDVLPLDPGDRIVLCCDGLWEMIRSEGIEDVLMQESDPQAACELMVSRANTAGGEDNISVIVFQVEGY